MTTLETAYNIIRKFHSEAPVNIEGIIREIGIQLDKKADLKEHISGQIQKISDDEYKISTNKNNHYFRQHFTMAHELGHYLFHKRLIGNGVDDNMMFRSTSEGDIFNQSITPVEETEANQFAASVLMPKKLIAELVDSGVTSDAGLARKLQVSESAIRIRRASIT